MPTTTSRQHAEIDELLPLDLDPEYRRPLSDPIGLLQWARPSRGNLYESEIHEFGSDIVNSVTIHVLRKGSNGLEDEVVALLT